MEWLKAINCSQVAQDIGECWSRPEAPSDSGPRFSLRSQQWQSLASDRMTGCRGDGATGGVQPGVGWLKCAKWPQQHECMRLLTCPLSALAPGNRRCFLKGACRTPTLWQDLSSARPKKKEHSSLCATRGTPASLSKLMTPMRASYQGSGGHSLPHKASRQRQARRQRQNESHLSVRWVSPSRQRPPPAPVFRSLNIWWQCCKLVHFAPVRVRPVAPGLFPNGKRCHRILFDLPLLLYQCSFYSDGKVVGWAC